MEKKIFIKCPPIPSQVFWIRRCMFWLLGIKREMSPTSWKVFCDQKQFSWGWSLFSEQSKIYISTQVIRIHWCLFWLLGITWKWDQPLRKYFATKKSSQKVGTSCQNILRYLPLPMLSGFTGACSGYLGSLGKFVTKKSSWGCLMGTSRMLKGCFSSVQMNFKGVKEISRVF